MSCLKCVKEDTYDFNAIRAYNNKNEMPILFENKENQKILYQSPSFVVFEQCKEDCDYGKYHDVIWIIDGNPVYEKMSCKNITCIFSDNKIYPPKHFAKHCYSEPHGRLH